MNENDISLYNLGLHDALMGMPMQDENGPAYECGYLDGNDE